jgi:hypothetical protein
VTTERWTVEEFAILLASPRLSDERLAEDLERRSAGAIGAVRQGVHLMDQSKPAAGMLSAEIIRFLEPRLPLGECAVCLGTSK